LRRQLGNTLDQDHLEYAINALDHISDSDRWQYEAISDLFRPVCYNTGKCEFMAEADRFCTIRDRVEANHAIGRESSEWHKSWIGDGEVEDVGDGVGYAKDGRPDKIQAIHPAEWLYDPTAAR